MMLRPKLHAVVKCLDAELTYVGWQTSLTIKHDYCSSYNPSQMSCHDDLANKQVFEMLPRFAANMVMCCKLKYSGTAKLTIKQISESFQTCTEQQSDL